MSLSTVPMQQLWPERSQNASDKQQTMEANLVNGLHIKSTGSHEVLHHGQLTLLGCPVQGCVSSIIRVKNVALHLGGKVLSNRKMAANGTQVKGIASSLHWAIRTGSQQITTCAHVQGAPCWTLVHTGKSELGCFHQHTTMNETKDIILYHKPYNVMCTMHWRTWYALCVHQYTVHIQSSIVEQHMWGHRSLTVH